MGLNLISLGLNQDLGTKIRVGGSEKDEIPKAATFECKIKKIKTKSSIAKFKQFWTYQKLFSVSRWLAGATYYVHMKGLSKEITSRKPNMKIQTKTLITEINDNIYVT